MKKVNVPIAKINKYLSVKVSMVFQTEAERHAESKDKFPGLLQVYAPNDKSAYITFTPRAFVTLELSKRSPDDQWSPNLTANLSSRTLYRFRINLKWIIQKILTDRDLFAVNDNNQLSIDRKRALGYARVINCGIGKTIKIQPAVIQDPYDESNVTAGSLLFINTYNYYAYLTVEDMRFLFDLLDKIDLFDYGCKIMSAYATLSRSINNQINNQIYHKE